MSSSSLPAETASRRALCVALLTGLASALVGVLIYLKSLAEATLPAILVPDQPLTFREIVDGLPVPKTLDWNLGRINQLLDLRDMGVFPEFLFGTLLLGSLWLLMVSILNPTFHLFHREEGRGKREETEERGKRGETQTLSEIRVRDSAKAGEAQALLKTSAEEGDGETGREREVRSPHETEADKESERETTNSETPLPLSSDGTVSPAESASLPSSLFPLPSPPVLWHLDRVHLEQAIRLLVLMAIPLVLVWMATGGVDMPATLHLAGKSEAVNHAWGLALRCMALGICFWIGFHPEGLAGRFGILHQVYQSEEMVSPGRDRPHTAAWGKLLLFGLLFGVGLYGLVSRTMPPPSHEFMAHYRALGTFTQTYWSEIALHFLGSTALAWFGAGVLLYLMGRPALRLKTRAALLLIPIGSAAAASTLSHSYTLSALTTRFDAIPAVLATAPVPRNPRFPGTGVPEGPAAGLELAKRLHLKTVSEPTQARNMILFHPRRGPIVTSLGDYSEDGIRVDADGVRRVQTYLEQHHYESALSWVATKYLYGDGALRFDITSQIRVCLQDMERGPHLRQCNQTTRTQLFVCAASPQNRALLDVWADESRFAHPDRSSQLLMGDLYLRFGAKEKALDWYRKAEMPSSFLANIRAEQPLFHQGRVTGRLLLNGKPLSGVQVGVVPHRLNGLPDDLKRDVFAYWEETAGMRPYSELFPLYHPRPYALCWISEGAITGKDGSFTLDNLTEGEYFLACTLPPQISCTVPEYPDMPPDPALHIDRAPKPFSLSYSDPSQNVGDIVLTYKK